LRVGWGRVPVFRDGGGAMTRLPRPGDCKPREVGGGWIMSGPVRSKDYGGMGQNVTTQKI